MELGGEREERGNLDEQAGKNIWVKYFSLCTIFQSASFFSLFLANPIST